MLIKIVKTAKKDPSMYIILLCLVSSLSAHLQAAHCVESKVRDAQDKIKIDKRLCVLPQATGLRSRNVDRGLTAEGIALLVTNSGATRHDIYAKDQDSGSACQFLSFKGIFEGKECKSATLSEDGAWIACADEKGIIMIAQYDKQSRKIKVVGKANLALNEYAAKVIFSPDNSRLIVMAVMEKLSFLKMSYKARVIIFDINLQMQHTIPLLKKCKELTADLTIDDAGKRIAVVWAGETGIASLDSKNFVQHSPKDFLCHTVHFGKNGLIFIGHKKRSEEITNICLYDFKSDITIDIGSIPIKYICRSCLGNNNELFIFAVNATSEFEKVVYDANGRVRFKFDNSYWFGPFVVTKDGKTVVSYLHKEERQDYTILRYGQEEQPAEPPTYAQVEALKKKIPSPEVKPSTDKDKDELQKSPDEHKKKTLVSSRKKYILRGVVAVVAFLTAYAAWKKWKKHKLQKHGPGYKSAKKVGSYWSKAAVCAKL